MPGVCAAGMNSPDGAALFDKESLLRHFSECLLQNVVTGTPFTAKFDQQIADTLLYGCVYPYRPALSQASEDLLQDYKHWLAWRANLTRAHTEAGFTLCFRLEEASPADIDNWRLHYLVASRGDPSLKLSLDDYWDLDEQTRVETIRHFCQDFEKNLLLALGDDGRSSLTRKPPWSSSGGNGWNLIATKCSNSSSSGRRTSTRSKRSRSSIC